jgi:hypothetical protein
MNGLDFCKRAYGVFEEIRRSPEKINGVRSQFLTLLK